MLTFSAPFWEVTAPKIASHTTPAATLEVGFRRPWRNCVVVVRDGLRPLGSRVP